MYRFPLAATSGNVIITVGGVASNGRLSRLRRPQTFRVISPTSGPTGAVVTIIGTNFGPTVGTRVSGVDFHGVAGKNEQLELTRRSSFPYRQARPLEKRDRLDQRRLPATASSSPSRPPQRSPT